MSMYDWSGDELCDRKAWRDCVKCRAAGEDAQMWTVWWHFKGIEDDL